MDTSILLELDVFTLMLMALGGYSLGFITLSIIWATHREIPGLGLWWWSSLCALAAQSLFFLQAFSPSMAGIWLANLLITICIALMPPALQRFFGGQPNWRAFMLFMLVYVLLLSWSVLFNDHMAPRVLLACLSYMVLGAVIVRQVWRHGYPAYLPAVLVFTVVNVLLYGFNLVRMGALFSGEVRVLMDQHVVNVLPFLSMLMARADKMARPGGLVVLDLDDFKQINDRHGHEAGDKVLAAVGRYLSGQPDLVAGRFGGEEFVLLLPERDPLAQQLRCEQLLLGMEALQPDGIRITASMGLAPCRHGWHFDTLFRQADRALYHAKGSGKNRVCQSV